MERNGNVNNAQKSNAPGSIPKAPERPTAIFNDLSAFGLDEAKHTRIYNPPVGGKKPGSSGSDGTQEYIDQNLYYKTFSCQVCGIDSQIPAVKTSSVRLLDKDTDFMPIYKEPNPLYYFAGFCRHCGFACIQTGMIELTERQKTLIRDKIFMSWKFDKQYPTYYTPATAIEIHKLALYNAVVANMKESIKAIICLHLGWLYRISGDAANEITFLKTAREGFERAYNTEGGKIAGLDKNSQQYLIGELLRRTGDPLGALNWYKLVLLDREAKQSLKDMTRDQKNKITALYYSGGLTGH